MLYIHFLKELLMNNKFFTLLTIMGMMYFSIAAIKPPQEEPKRNLKVLPKDISPEELDKIMHDFNDALGVKCNFCHAAAGEADANGRVKLNFASDEKEEKEAARHMWTITQKLNKKYFHWKDEEGNYPQVITCVTCHNGSPHPKK